MVTCARCAVKHIGKFPALPAHVQKLAKELACPTYKQEKE